MTEDVVLRRDAVWWALSSKTARSGVAALLNDCCRFWFKTCWSKAIKRFCRHLGHFRSCLSLLFFFPPSFLNISAITPCPKMFNNFCKHNVMLNCICMYEVSPLGSTFQAIVSVMAVKIQLSSPRGVRLSLSLPGILQHTWYPCQLQAQHAPSSEKNKLEIALRHYHNSTMGRNSCVQALCFCLRKPRTAEYSCLFMQACAPLSRCTLWNECRKEKKKESKVLLWSHVRSTFRNIQVVVLLQQFWFSCCWFIGLTGNSTSSIFEKVAASCWNSEHLLMPSEILFMKDKYWPSCSRIKNSPCM